MPIQSQLFDTPASLLKALTIKQPWASLIVEGVKDVENRSWRTNYRGRLIIHAAATPVRGMQSEGPTSAILGSVDVIDCVRDSDSDWASEGAWHWVLVNPVRFRRPISCKGTLGLWDVTLDI